VLSVGAHGLRETGGEMLNQFFAASVTVSKRFVAADDGVTAIEYGLIAALVAVAIIGALNSTSLGLIATYAFWSAAVNAAISGAL
jgi:pilus assembly protein Flp/PilA